MSQGKAELGGHPFNSDGSQEKPKREKKATLGLVERVQLRAGKSSMESAI